ncbi:hypothetical protein F0562_001675 [Nyssa sinensis]|uniref:U-box domain-containing protein n=1 Tax=Nyssa sinensis TaxID=561372 RepID=A0A5J5C3W5_9ASTE|nr:hypothetical protein F0562_001675 [Nyssa sinensis]
MKEPMTAVTGITYDRESIERWLLNSTDTTCPVTKQPLPKDSDLTPNHTLRRLIQAWCRANAEKGVDQIPTPKSPLNKSHVFKLLRDLHVPHMYINALKKMEGLACENEKNRSCMVEAGAIKAMVSFIIRCFKEGRTTGLEEALRIIHLIWTPTAENIQLVKENFEFMESIIWVLQCNNMDNHAVVKSHAVLVLKVIIEVAGSNLLGQLKFEFFKQAVKILRWRISQQATKAVLHVLIKVCPWGRNRSKIIEAGAVFDLIELELNNAEKKTSELIFCLLGHLCSYADGREQLLKHAGAIAMVSKRILRVSPATDDRAVHILWLISKLSATQQILLEMLRVGAVSKLCMVLQADSEKHLKNKAREILRLHNNVWNNSPCIAVYLMTRDPRVIKFIIMVSPPCTCLE